MSKIVEEILTSTSSLNDESTSFALALYLALDIDEKFYHYEASSKEKFIQELLEFYINQLAAIDVYGAKMFSKRPIHLIKLKQPFSGILSTIAMYSNGAISIDQIDGDMVIHIWISKDLIELYNVPKPEDLKSV
jgi:hypothetical protein